MSLAESYSGMSSPPHDFGKADDHLKDSRLSIVNNQLEEDEVLETEVGALKKAKAKSFT